MAKKIKQFRFYGLNHADNFPAENYKGKPVSYTDYITGSIFREVYPISQLGIQALPGTKFYLNNSINPIYIGLSGYYDLEIKNGIRVYRLGFDEKSLENINDTGSSALIVDIIYGEEEED